LFTRDALGQLDALKPSGITSKTPRSVMMRPTRPRRLHQHDDARYALSRQAEL